MTMLRACFTAALSYAGMVKLVDTPDSKSGAREGVPVRLRLPVPSLLKNDCVLTVSQRLGSGLAVCYLGIMAANP